MILRTEIKNTAYTNVICRPGRIEKTYQLFGSIYDDSGHVIKHARNQAQNIRRDYCDPDQISLEKTVNTLKGKSIYLGQYSERYGHFLLDTLSRFHSLLEDHNFDYYLFHPYLDNLNEIDPAFSPMNVVLDCFNIPKEKVYLIKEDTQVEHIIIPETFVFLKNYIHPDQSKIYNKLVSYAQKMKPDFEGIPKVFISRSKLDKTWRDVSNQNEVEDVFLDFGFEMIHPQEIDFLEQILVYHNADMLCGFSGSGMHNCLFQKKNKKCIVLGDIREPNAAHINQMLCQELSKIKAHYIPLNEKEINGNALSTFQDINYLKNQLKNIFSEDFSDDTKIQSQTIFCVLGMPIVVKTFLGCLQNAGIYIGRTKSHNYKKSPPNRGNKYIELINNIVLNYNNVAKDNSKSVDIKWNAELVDKLELATSEMTRQSSVWAFFDKNSFVTLPFLKENISNLQFIGIFQHPLDLIFHLKNKSPENIKRFLEKWISFNTILLEEYQKKAFHIVCYSSGKKAFLNQFETLIHLLEKENKEELNLSFQNAKQFYIKAFKKSDRATLQLPQTDEIKQLRKEAIILFKKLMACSFLADKENGLQSNSKLSLNRKSKENPMQGNLNLIEFPFDEIIKKIKNNDPLVINRLCHGFWEFVESHYDFLFPNGTLRKYTPADIESYKDQPINRRAFMHEGFGFRLLELIQTHLKKENHYFCVSDLAWPHGKELEGTPFKPRAVSRTINKIIPKEIPLYNGLWPKVNLFNNKLDLLFKTIKNKEVLVVGPVFSKSFLDGIKCTKGSFIEIDHQLARKEHREILTLIKEKLNDLQSENPIVLFESGNLSVYWTLSLYKEYPHVTFIDLGQILEIFNLENLDNRNFGRIWRNEVISFLEENNYLQQSLKRYKYPRPIIDKNKSLPIAFVEDKFVDEALTQSLLNKSKEKNHWANGGPVLNLLENEIKICIDENIPVICTSNCTVSVRIAIQAAMYREKKPLKWISSSYSFFSSSLNELRDVSFVDCDKSGLIDLSLLKKRNINNYDGIVLTIPFGYHFNLNPYINFAKNNNKYLIIDNAPGLTNLDRSKYADKIIEVVSFHHTKPFGFGEGGAIICTHENESIIRKLINFGVKLENNKLSLGTNGKMSDIAAAYILQRLSTRKEWSHLYWMQAKRMDRIAQLAGLKRLIRPIKKFEVVSNLPVLSSRPTTLDSLSNPLVVLRKYYRPLHATPIATDIYNRIINIPCHPDLANIPSEKLYDLFKSLA